MLPPFVKLEFPANVGVLVPEAELEVTTPLSTRLISLIIFGNGELKYGCIIIKAVIKVSKISNNLEVKMYICARYKYE